MGIMAKMKQEHLEIREILKLILNEIEYESVLDIGGGIVEEKLKELNTTQPNFSKVKTKQQKAK